MHYDLPGSTNRLASWAERRPIRFGLAIVVSTTLLYILTQVLMGPLSATISRDVLNVIASVLVLAGFAGLTTAMGWWREAGFRAPRGRDLLVLWVPAITLAATYAGVRVTTAGGVALLVVAAVLTGFLEEIIFRGLILRAFLPGGPVRAAVASTIFFALFHLDRLAGGASLTDTLIQLGFTLAGGLFAAALALRTRSLWPGILYHTLYDLLLWLGHGGLTMPVEPTTTWKIISVSGQMVLLVYGIILLRGRRP